MNGAGGDARHDEFRKLFRNFEEAQSVPNVGPFYPIKGLFEVNLKDHIARLALYFAEVRDDLLNNNGVVVSFFVGQKTSLTFPNNVEKVGLESVSNDFCN